MQNKHTDVAILGAGISGISTAYHLQRDCPNQTYSILESRGWQDEIHPAWESLIPTDPDHIGRCGEHG